MIKIKKNEEIELLRRCSLLVGETLAEVAKVIKPGIKTIDLDTLAEEFIRDNGALPGFKGYGGFPGTLCISVNDAVVHGIPGNYVLKEGDIVSVDCGTIIDGYYGDSAYTFGIGEISKEVSDLLVRTEESLNRGIEQAVAGNRVGDIGSAVQRYAEHFGYGVVRELVGHGIGKEMHEDPEIPNYGMPGMGVKLREGMTVCIEPMINLGTKSIVQESDGWTIRTADGKPSAHFEREIAIRNGKADVLTSYDGIKKVLENK
ncbi:MAG: type I methionyl aminopeptidase [Bacteroidota bacterium]|nr:type I methionyl aminopeptidase [Bacteroidota bacterium]